MRTSSSSELGTIPPSQPSPLRFAEWSDEEARADFDDFLAEKERDIQELVALPAAERHARLPQDLRRNFAEDADYVRRLHAEAERRAQCMRAATRAVVAQGVHLHVIHGGRRERRTPSAKRADSTSSDDADYGLVATVTNIGESALPPGVIVGFYAGTPGSGQRIGEGATTQTLYSAQAESVVLLLANPPAGVKEGTTPVYAIVDDTQVAHPAWHECRTDNNVGVGTGACATPN